MPWPRWRYARVRPAGDRNPVDENDTDHLAKSEGDDSKVIATQPQDRKTEQHPEKGGKKTSKRQRHPERKVEILRQQGKGIGPDRIKRDIAKIEQPGEPDHDVQPPPQHHVDQHQRREVDKGAVGERQERHDHRKGDARHR